MWKENFTDKRRLENIVETLACGLVVYDGEGIVTTVNTRTAEMLGRTADELIGRSFRDAVWQRYDLDGNPFNPDEHPVAHVLRTGEAVFDYEFINKRKDGIATTTSVNATPLKDEAGEMVGVVLAAIDTTERRHMEMDLMKAKEHAEQMNRVKTALLANMSHEIRTPLTAILGYASLLTRRVSQAERPMLARIEAAGNRLLETLESVLLLSELESDTTDLKKEAVTVYAVARKIAEVLRPPAEAKGLDLRVNAEEGAEDVQARLDESGLRRIIRNLVSNAIKFTDEGGVTVRVLVEGESVVLEVADTGIGIDFEFRTHVFQPFLQESEGITRSYEGTGLGLSICQRLTQEMGGAITLESEKGRGSTFRVSFPLLEVEDGDAQAFEEPLQTAASENLKETIRGDHARDHFQDNGLPGYAGNSFNSDFRLDEPKRL